MRGLVGCLVPLLLLGQAAASRARDSQPEPAPLRALTGIRHHAEARSTVVVVEADGPIAYAYSSPDAWSAVVELLGCDASALPGLVEIDTPEVEQVRIETGPGLDGAEQVRIEVSLRGPYYHQVYPRGHDLHLVFERPPAPRGGTPEPETAGGEEPDPAPEAPDGPEVGTPAAAASEPSRSSTPSPGPPPTTSARLRPPTAVRILDVAVDDAGGRLAVTVTADGTVLYEDFYVDEPPDRLVVNFANVVIDPASRSLPVDQGGLLGVRLAQFSVSPQKIVRLVLDLKSRLGYRILERADGITIELEPAPTPQP